MKVLQLVLRQHIIWTRAAADMDMYVDKSILVWIKFCVFGNYRD